MGASWAHPCLLYAPEVEVAIDWEEDSGVEEDGDAAEAETTSARAIESGAEDDQGR
jgi:hypothetical protein